MKPLQSDITITKVPSYSTAQRIVRENVKLLTDRSLISKYVKAVAIRHALNTKLATDDYFNGVCSFAATGKSPRDMWLRSNINYFISEAKPEIAKRNLENSFTVWLEMK